MKLSTMTLPLVVAGIALSAATAGAEAPPRAEIRMLSARSHRLSSARDAIHSAPTLPAQAAREIALRKPAAPGGNGGRCGVGGGSWSDPVVPTTATAGL